MIPASREGERPAAAPSAGLPPGEEGCPQAILRDALARHRGRIALVSSFGAESAVLLHMVAVIDRATPVVFLDTGQLFAQTVDHRRDLARRLRLSDVRDIRPAFVDLALNDPRADLWRTDADACCGVRKVQPLERALKGFDAWITGRKRFHGGGRAQLPTVERDADGRFKINPLAGWSKPELDAYVLAHELPPHPLSAQGYASVGCWPCTAPAEEGRAGRWAGSAKTECGIHRPPRPAPDLGGGL